MALITNRRSLITGLVSLVAAPAIVRATSLMPVKSWYEPWSVEYWKEMTPGNWQHLAVSFKNAFLADVYLDGVWKGQSQISNLKIFAKDNCVLWFPLAGIK